MNEAGEGLGSTQVLRSASLFPGLVGTRLLSLQLLSPSSNEVIRCPLDIQAGLEQPVEVTGRKEQNSYAFCLKIIYKLNVTGKIAVWPIREQFCPGSRDYPPHTAQQGDGPGFPPISQGGGGKGSQAWPPGIF